MSLHHQAHSQSHGEHGESWKAELVRELHEFQEDDAKQQANHLAFDKCWRDVFEVVLNQFVEESRKDGLNANLNGKELHFSTKSARMNINFVGTVTSSGVAISANNGRYDGSHQFLVLGGDIKTITQKTVFEYLVEQLREVKPKS